MTICSYNIVEKIGVICLNNPPVNALSQAVRESIHRTVTEAQSDASRVLVILCEGRTFIAGADIREFGKPTLEPSLPEVLNTIEQSGKPVIAAIHGTALGGGFELALACHYRCALNTAVVGFPEVKLGLLPGAGGTQRVPRLAGIEAALDLIISGNSISADKAHNIKLVDRVVTQDLRAGALAFAKELVEAQAPPRRVRDIAMDSATVLTGFFENYRNKQAKRARGQIAPQHIVTCIEAAINLPMDEGLARERELFQECMQSSQSTAMRHLFFAEREAAKVKDVPRNTPVREINSVGIIGGGTMGCGIAMNFANVGIPVSLLEVNNEAVGRSLAIIDKNYEISLSKGKLDEQQKANSLSRIQGRVSYEDLTDVDLVIEAVFENVKLKKQVFTKLDNTCKPSAILATNTSYQDIDQIAAVTRRPGDVIGLHFFSPANVMKLLEIVRGGKTADDVIATAMNLAKTINKKPVLSGNCYGFIGNRILQHYGREAQLCLIEGASPEQIDSVMQNFGMAMGPLAVSDLAGLDIGYKARQALTEEQKGDPKTYCIADALVEMGRLGQKSDAGYYRYDPQTRARISDTDVMQVVQDQASAQGIRRRKIDDDEIRNRLTCAMINEGARILQEGIAQRPGDIDVVYVYGYGFPAFRGGPMHYAESIGLDKVCRIICELRKLHGERYWTPAPLLEKLVHEQQTFSEWAKGT